MANNCNDITTGNTRFRVAEETTFGKSVQSGFKTYNIVSDSVTAVQNRIDSEIIKSGRSPSKPGIGYTDVTGNLEVPLDNVSAGFWIKQALGDYTYEADHIPGKNLHTFNVSDTCLDSFQAEKSFAGSDVTYKSVGLKVNELGIEFGGEGEVKASLGIIGKNSFFTTIQADAPSEDFSVDYAINTKNITLIDASSLSKGDTVIIKRENTDLASGVSEGYSSIEVTDASGLNSEEYIQISGITYRIESISSNLIVLDRPIEAAALTGVIVYDVNEGNIIESVSGNDIVLKNGLKKAVVAATDSLEGSSAAPKSDAESFQNTAISFTSVDGSVVVGAVKTFGFSFSNNANGERLLNDRGTVGKILEGTTTISGTMEVLFNAENARFIEGAKSGKEFDVTVGSTLPNGDSISFIFPKGSLSVSTPEVSGSGAISVSLTYNPYGTSTTEAMTVELLNTQTSY